MTKAEKKLLAIFNDLDKNDCKSLLSYAEFLLEKAKKEGRFIEASEAGIKEPGIEEPVIIPRPSEERVVAAIKRLSATFPMLKKDTMLNETASLMTQHLVQGRAAEEVIDELEILFQNRYKEFCKQMASDKAGDNE